MSKDVRPPEVVGAARALLDGLDTSEVSEAGRSLVGALDALGGVRINNERIVARGTFGPEDAKWGYAVVTYPSVGNALRRDKFMPPNEWHVYLPPEGWEGPRRVMNLMDWIEHPWPVGPLRDRGRMWLAAIMAQSAALEVVGEDDAKQEPLIWVVAEPSGPLSTSEIILAFRWPSGRVVVVSESPAEFVPGAAEFHESWRAPTVSIKAAGRRFL